MRRRRATPLLLLLLATAAAAEPDVVHVLSSFNQAVTSSILRWVSVKPGAGEALPDNAVMGAVESRQPEEEDREATESETGERRLGEAFVCRLRREGMWLPGEVRSAGRDRGLCVVTMHGLIYKEPAFEVLDNAEDGARLSWVRWDKYSRVPAGTVTADGVSYVARRAASGDGGYSYRLGKLDPDGLGRLTVVTADGAADFEDGEVLVETEPVSYELTDVRFNLWRKRVQKTARRLGSARLTNSDEPTAGVTAAAGRVDTVIAYRYNYSVTWGHGAAHVITGLPVSARLHNGSALESFKWGIDTTREQQDLYAVEAMLPPGTAVDVQLHGNYTDANMPYTANLTAVYADGERRTRNVTGSRRELAMWDVQPQFGQAYFLANGSLVPATTTTTTTTTTTSTTSTTSTTTGRTTTTRAPQPIPSPMEEEVKRKKKPDGDKGARAGENSSMQSDEGGATRAATSAAAAVVPAALQCLPLLLLLLAAT